MAKSKFKSWNHMKFPLLHLSRNFTVSNFFTANPIIWNKSWFFAYSTSTKDKITGTGRLHHKEEGEKCRNRKPQSSKIIPPKSVCGKLPSRLPILSAFSFHCFFLLSPFSNLYFSFALGFGLQGPLVSVIFTVSKLDLMQKPPSRKRKKRDQYASKGKVVLESCIGNWVSKVGRKSVIIELWIRVEGPATCTVAIFF